MYRSVWLVNLAKEILQMFHCQMESRHRHYSKHNSVSSNKHWQQFSHRVVPSIAWLVVRVQIINLPLGAISKFGVIHSLLVPVF
jgi:hypothetical protein